MYVEQLMFQKILITYLSTNALGLVLVQTYMINPIRDILKIIPKKSSIKTNMIIGYFAPAIIGIMIVEHIKFKRKQLIIRKYERQVKKLKKELDKFTGIKVTQNK